MVQSSSTLIVTTPANDPNLLTPEQCRLAIGLGSGDTSQDAALLILNGRVSSDICSACGVAVANNAEPTLRQETLTETFIGSRLGPLILSRRHRIEVTSLTEGGGLLDASQFMIEAEAGMLVRWSGTSERQWSEASTVVVYKAGFATVPGDLVGVAGDLLRLRKSEASRDALVRSERVDIPGVEEVQRDYWVNAAGTTAATGPVPPEYLARLRRYRNLSFA